MPSEGSPQGVGFREEGLGVWGVGVLGFREDGFGVSGFRVYRALVLYLDLRYFKKANM